MEAILDSDTRGTASFLERHPVRCFLLFALCHASLWTMLPVLTQPNAPIDTLEMIYWGTSGNPVITNIRRCPSGWLNLRARSARTMFGRRTCFVSWRRSAVSGSLPDWPRGNATGLLAVALLEGCYYYNFTTTEFNNNVTSRVWWALTIHCLYRGVKHHRLVSWILAGVCLGLGMLSKHDTAILAIVMAVFSVIHPAGRQCWKTPGPAACLLAALVVFAPHVVWLFSNDFPTANYFLRRSGSEHQWSSHLILPMRFAAICGGGGGAGSGSPADADSRGSVDRISLEVPET
jgi:hypothetical protein